MATTGTATIDFGAFPGSSDASVAVTGQTGILTTSLIEAWLMPTIDTTHHFAAEQMIDPPDIIAANIVAGTGFTIYARPRWPSSQLYGEYNVAWVWN